ncbi:MAG TPA: YceI family protein [Polyangia bacterium]|nr:YceI family protein [Polyangia bacterium]
MTNAKTPSLDGHPRRTLPARNDDAVRAVLYQDYERLERQLQSIVAQSARRDPIALRIAWQTFENELIRHCQDEGEHVLPAFAEKNPDEAQALLAQHKQICSNLSKLAADLDLNRLPVERIADFVATFRDHLRHENDVLYPWAAHWLEEAARGRIHEELSIDETPVPTETWLIDLAHSRLRFTLRHIVVHEIHGQFWRWGGTIVLNNDDLARSSVHLWVDLASVDTADGERDVQIRSAEFFDVEHFQQATFSSSEVEQPEHGNPIVRGRLALHGFMEEVEAEIVRDDRWTDANGVEWTSYEIRSHLDRRRFGLRWNQDPDTGGVVVGDEIEIVADVQAMRLRPDQSPSA